ncbi:nephrocan-like [Callorhinchus milii]|uniref:Insulin-like growth factor-binding protein complex acid labile subunit n=1 Tax=Callorhinchus milii TaxID=7868 RepID=A0A4W3H989_CALMI|nr:nephrocan-like [Callorhinchus milii]|eukprot:gi/632963365/ref/XP_007897840.1/ PREDICTED: insulin-like growth factor-binding protein complex acid labile subunit [Callorhinchus milii]
MLTKMLVLLCALSAVTCLSLCLGDCPKRCVCDSSKEVQCYRITSVPRAIPRDTRKVHLGRNNIKQLRVSDFNGLTRLEDLVLVSCGVEVAEANTFTTLKNLRTLELWKNKLRNVPGKFPSNLEVLKLGNNRIQNIRETDFEGLTKLKVLELQNNRISAIHTGVLSSIYRLESLVLDGNGLEILIGPLKLAHLKRLSIQNNKLSSLPSNFFSFLPSLLFLSLSGNAFRKVPQEMPPSLWSLKLDRNMIRVLRIQDMNYLSHLSELSLSENRLSAANEALALTNLSIVDLSKNHLKSVPTRFPSQLRTLDCSHNFIQKLTLKEFTGLCELKHLFLEYNNITFIDPDALQHCLHLSDLALEQNHLSFFPNGLPDTLIRLDLKGNNIKIICKETVEKLKRLQVLNLRNNRLSSLNPDLLGYLPRLKRLYLDGNPWNCTCDLMETRMFLTARYLDIRSGHCATPVHYRGETWISSIKVLNSCGHNSKSGSKGKAILPNDAKKAQNNDSLNTNSQTDNEEYYDYDTD